MVFRGGALSFIDITQIHIRAHWYVAGRMNTSCLYAILTTSMRGVSSVCPSCLWAHQFCLCCSCVTALLSDAHSIRLLREVMLCERSLHSCTWSCQMRWLYRYLSTSKMSVPSITGCYVCLQHIEFSCPCTAETALPLCHLILSLVD